MSVDHSDDRIKGISIKTNKNFSLKVQESQSEIIDDFQELDVQDGKTVDLGEFGEIEESEPSRRSSDFKLVNLRNQKLKTQS